MKVLRFGEPSQEQRSASTMGWVRRWDYYSVRVTGPSMALEKASRRSARTSTLAPRSGR